MKAQVIGHFSLVAIAVLLLAGCGDKGGSSTFSSGHSSRPYSSPQVVAPAYPKNKAGVISYLEKEGTYLSSTKSYSVHAEGYRTEDGTNYSTFNALTYYPDDDHFVVSGALKATLSSGTASFLAIASFTWGSYTGGSFGGSMSATNSSGSAEAIVVFTSISFFTDGELKTVNWTVTSSSFPRGYGGYSSGVQLLLTAYNAGCDFAQNKLSQKSLPSFY